MYPILRVSLPGAFGTIRFNRPFSSNHQCSLNTQIRVFLVLLVLLPEITVEFALSIVVTGLEVTNVPLLRLGDATFERDIEPVGISGLREKITKHYIRK